MTTRQALNARLAAKRGHVTCSDDFIEGLRLLRSTEQLKAFFGELVDSLQALTPEEPGSKLYAARRDGALNLFEKFREKAEPDASEVWQLLTELLKAAVSTRKEPSEQAPPPASPAASSAFTATAVYAKRKGSAI